MQAGMWSRFGNHATSGRFRDRLKTLNNYSGGPYFFFQARFNITEFYLGLETISEIMHMDWEAEWDDLSNNDPWVTETHLAGSTQKAVQDFRKWWNRYLPSFSATLIR